MAADGDVVELLERLIGFDTTSDKSNLPLIDFVEAWLADQGVATTRVPDETGQKANLIATLGPTERPGLVLSGHTDVVPVDGQAWTSDPFRCVERDGCLYGRGSADMKGFLATVLGRVPAWRELRLQAPIHLAFSYDEEVGCKGVPSLLDGLLAEVSDVPLGAVIGEPTMMRPVSAHKGKGGYRVTVVGRAGHSALPDEGVNAIGVAAAIIQELGRRGRAFKTDGPQDAGFDPPHCTVSVGTIAGGTAMNIIPEACSFVFEVRTLPEVDPADVADQLRTFVDEMVLPEIRAVAPEAEVRIEELIRYPGLFARADEFAHVVSELARDGAVVGKVAFGTEAGHFQRRGIPAMVCGPGDIAVAHKPDEWVEVGQLEMCGAFLDRLVQRTVVAR